MRTNSPALKLSLIIALSLSWCGMALSQIMLVDFGNNGTNGSQTTSPDSNGNYWNNSFSGGFTIASSPGLITTTNVATGYGLVYTTPVATNSAGLGVTAAPGVFNIATAYQDAIFTTDTVTGITFKITGLDASKTYSFDLFGSRDATTTRSTAYTITGSTSLSGNLQTSGTDLGGVGINHNIATALTLAGIAPDVNNEIFINLKAVNTGSNFGYLNALKITAIPEPGTYAMLLVGLAALVALRRRVR